MSNLDIEGNVPGDAEPAAPVGTPEYFEQQLAKEREARARMRERLRNTEALAAESHALRTRLAQELERVTAERDRLRSAVASASEAAPSAANAPTAASTTAGTPAAPASRPEPVRSPPVAPPMTPRFGERPFRPPTRSRRKAPWLALTMLAGLAVGVGALAWFNGAIPGLSGIPGVSSVMTALAPAGTPPDAASAPVVAAASPTIRSAASVALASTAAVPAPAPLPNGAVALPPLTPEAQLAATPTAAGNASSAQPPALPGRLRAALDGEGIVAPVDVDAATGRVDVSDPAADNAQRDRTDTIIRAVYAGASLPEPQIEHRWLSPPRAGRAASAVQSGPDATAPVAVAKTSAHAPSAHATSTHATPARAAEHARRGEVVADAQDVPAILPAGRFAASCKASTAGASPTHRATEMSACMKHSCCSSANRQSEECRAYVKAYPSTCTAG